MLTILCHITQCKRLMLKSGMRDSAIAQENVMLKVYISMRSILLHFRQVFSLPSRSAAKVVGATLMLSLLVAGGMIFAQSRAVKAFEGEGAGSVSDPYQITYCSELQAINDHPDAHFVLTQDINCDYSRNLNNNTGFLPITGKNGTGFTGVLDGRNHTITDLYIDSIDVANGIGLFAKIDTGGVVKNVSFSQSNSSYLLIKSSSEKGSMLTGVVAGSNYGTIENVSSSQDVKGYGYTGGLVGINYGSIRRSAMKSRVAYGSTQTSNVLAYGQKTGTTNVTGGLVGYNVGTITDSYADTRVEVFDAENGNVFNYCGGLVGGYNGGSISNSYSEGTIHCKGYGSTRTGIGGFFGFAGAQPSVLQHNFARSNVWLGSTGGSESIGGFGGTYNPATYQTVIFADNYYDAYATGLETCIWYDETGCHQQNLGNSDPYYFLGNTTNAPLDGWDFTNVWSTVDGSVPNLRPAILPPDPPSGLQATRDGTNYPLSWTAMDISPAVTDYKIEYRVAVTGLIQNNGQSGWTTYDDGISTGTEATVPNLSRSTSYEFRVRAENALGVSYPSRGVIVNEDIPSKPLGLQATSKVRTISLSWDKTEPGSVYFAEYQEAGQTDWKVAPFGLWDTPQMGIYNLKPATTYKVRVTARNTAGWGPASDEITLTTDVLHSYTISNCQQLQDMQNDLAGIYTLDRDIDCSATVSWNNNKGFQPIGSSPDVFNGTFDGQGHTISGLYIDSTADIESGGSFGLANNINTIAGFVKGVGLFGVAASTSIHDFKMQDASVSANYLYGAPENLLTILPETQGAIAAGSAIGVLATTADGVHDITVTDSDVNSSVISGGVIGYQLSMVSLTQMSLPWDTGSANLSDLTMERGNTEGLFASGGVIGGSTLWSGVGPIQGDSRSVDFAYTNITSSASVKGWISGGISGLNVSVDDLIATLATTFFREEGVVTGSDFERGIVGDTAPRTIMTNVRNTGSVTNCRVVSIGANGGILGIGVGVKMTNVSNTGTVSQCADTSNDAVVYGGAMGGISGILVNSQIFDSTNAGTVAAVLVPKDHPTQAQSYGGLAGGMVGAMMNLGGFTDKTMIARSSSSGNVTIDGGETVTGTFGGLVGTVLGTGTFDSVTATGNVVRDIKYRRIGDSTLGMPPNVTASGGLIGAAIGLDMPLALANSLTPTQGINITNSHASGLVQNTIQAPGQDATISGGLIGIMLGEGNLNNVYATGAVTNDSDDTLSSFVEPAPGSPDNVPLEEQTWIFNDRTKLKTHISGGLIGAALGASPTYYLSLTNQKTPGLTIYDSHASGSSKGLISGGLIGITELKTSIEKTYAEGTVHGTVAGGFIGVAGVASNAAPVAGGLAEEILSIIYPINEANLDVYQSVSPIEIRNTYTTSPIEATPLRVEIQGQSQDPNYKFLKFEPFDFPTVAGGFIGAMAAPGGKIENSYASGTITANNAAQGPISKTALKIVSKTTNGPAWFVGTAKALGDMNVTIPTLPNITGGIYGFEAGAPLLKFGNVLQATTGDLGLDNSNISTDHYALLSFSEPTSLKNVFSASKIQATGYTFVGATSGGFISPYTGIWEGYLPASNIYRHENVFADKQTTTTADCSGLLNSKDFVDDNAGQYFEIPEFVYTMFPPIACNSVNTDGTQPRYFINNKVNAPLDTWDFGSVWVTRKNDYPKFTGEPGTPTGTGTGGTNPSTSPNPIPNPTQSVAPNAVPPVGSGTLSSLTGEGGLNRTNLRDATLLDRFLSQVRNLPDSVAVAIPFFLIVLLIMLGIMYGRQAWLERRNQRALDAVVTRYKATREAGQNFVGLTSHYLNTPISIMQTALDLLQSLKKVTKPQADAILATVNALAIHVKSMILSSQQLNAKVKQSLSDQKQKRQEQWWRKVTFLIPAVVVGGLLVLLAVIYGAAGRPTNLTIAGLQVFAFLLAVGLIILAHTSKEQSIDLRHSLENQMIIEKDLFEKRIAFIESVANELDMDIAQVELKSKALWKLEEAKPFVEGFSNLAAIITRFKNLKTFSRIEPTTKVPVQFSNAVAEAVKSVSAAGAKRKITIKSDVPLNVVSHTNATAVHQLLTSVLDNAIKFGDTGSVVHVKVEAHDKTIEASIINTGPGIPADKLSQLMMPFYRATDVFRFDYEGLGLSLYLDKVIMEHIGGELIITSKPGAQTMVRLIFPR